MEQKYSASDLSMGDIRTNQQMYWKTTVGPIGLNVSVIEFA